MEPRVKYNRVADALYTRLKDARIADSDEDAPGVIVDYGKNGEIVGIEILQASNRKLDLIELVTKGPATLVAEA